MQRLQFNKMDPVEPQDYYFGRWKHASLRAWMESTCTIMAECQSVVNGWFAQAYLKYSNVCTPQEWPYLLSISVVGLLAFMQWFDDLKTDLFHDLQGLLNFDQRVPYCDWNLIMSRKVQKIPSKIEELTKVAADISARISYYLDPTQDFADLYNTLKSQL
ncbi:putative aldolase protein [Ranid herpesvirus 3]|uniref:Putative aldolase protein n=1 Tax=Ranid herpesvirus 3 TaxID=1987509 RepID=A0A1X9T5J4_9VIRU|nr:putative aldolase protein [Ranid herpesvirus 3]ARR28974.1 putative aldolase protein [Ranid herpesvirus 3]